MQAGGMADSYIDIQKKVLGPYGKSVMKAKNGAKITKAKSGTSLGMKSVKAKYDNNSNVTRADFVAIGKGESGKAKYGKTMKAKPKKKMMMGGKCKNGC